MSNSAIDLTPHVVSGKIDNSVKGKTIGELVINGLDEPLLIDLNGNAQPDLAGCVLTFQNPRSLPVDPALMDYLVSNQTGFVGPITATRRGETLVDDEWMVTCLLNIEWLNFSILTPFIILTGDYKLEIDLPRWTMTEPDIELQQKELQAGRRLFQEMYQEWEEECIEADEAEYRHQVIKSIMPQLQLAKSDGERISLLREALGSNVHYHELEEFLSEYFGDDQCSGAAKAYSSETVPLDEELKALGNQISEMAKLLLFRAKIEEAPRHVIETGEQISNAMYSMLHSSTLLDSNPDGPRIEPRSILRQLRYSSIRCERVISKLELKGSAREKQICEPVWDLLKEIRRLIALLQEKNPEQTATEDFEDDDIPF